MDNPTIAVIGGGIAGLTAAWQLQRLGRPFTLFEASPRLGGTVETVRRDGFVIETGPDGWVTEKPWARELAEDLGLGPQLIGSNDATRVTYLVQAGQLVAMPAGMRMMVPTNLAALASTSLFSPAAQAAYAAEPARAGELRASAPQHDESIASFVTRHFGEEVLHKVAGPLLSGVFGGDVTRLSVRAVMPRFVQLEQVHGSLIQALAQTASAAAAAGPVFTTLSNGLGTLTASMAAELPEAAVRLQTAVLALEHNGAQWQLTSANGVHRFDTILIAVPAHVASGLLHATDQRLSQLLTLDASSAVLAALAFDQPFDLPPGFGFLAPAGEGSDLLAATFTDQKFPGRVPPGGRLLRGFYGGARALELAGLPDAEIAARTLDDLTALLGPLPPPRFAVVRHWPRSLPQYETGHLDRVAELETLAARQPGLHLLGNALHGVGLPDLIRHARALAAAV